MVEQLPCSLQHGLNLILGGNTILNEGVVPLLWITSYTASLSG